MMYRAPSWDSGGLCVPVNAVLFPSPDPTGTAVGSWLMRPAVPSGWGLTLNPHHVQVTHSEATCNCTLFCGNIFAFHQAWHGLDWRPRERFCNGTGGTPSGTFPGSGGPRPLWRTACLQAPFKPVGAAFPFTIRKCQRLTPKAQRQRVGSLGGPQGCCHPCLGQRHKPTYAVTLATFSQLLRLRCLRNSSLQRPVCLLVNKASGWWRWYFQWVCAPWPPCPFGGGVPEKPGTSIPV